MAAGIDLTQEGPTLTLALLEQAVEAKQEARIDTILA
jgi:hypothetical protein